MIKINEKYKNIDKSTQLILDDTDSFKIIYFNNLETLTEYFSYTLRGRYIQLFFCLNSTSKIAFNIEHCAISLEENHSGLVYIEDEKIDLLFELNPNSQLIVVLIPINHFHQIFSKEGDILFEFNKFKIGQPIIETKEITTSTRFILNQMVPTHNGNQKMMDSLKPIYFKGKVYELLSFYFNHSPLNENEVCPYIANEDEMGKIKQAKDIILEQMNQPPSLPELAKMVGLNIKKLKSGFKEVYGLPVFGYLLNYKMELARDLLLEQQFNVSEIAMQLGYSTSSHFIAAFKRKYGITPKQFSKA
jgi:AraC-like DNA-binding protein